MSNMKLSRFAARSAIAVCFLWAGMILGVSFLATGVKFTAPSLSLPVALDVGRQTFGFFNKVEIFWAAWLIGLLLLRPGFRVSFCCGLVVALLAVQTLWLLPILDARVGMILAKQIPPPSSLHNLYPLADLVKLVALLAAGAFLLRDSAPAPPS